MNTVASWISKTPGVCGGDACIRTTRHTVHGLVEWKRLGVSDEKLLTKFRPPLTQDDLDAAWKYADEHPDEIERALWADRAVMVAHGPGSPPPPELIAEGRRLGFSDDAIRDAFMPPLTAEEWTAFDHGVTDDERPIRTAADVLNSGIVGIWAGRTDIGDSREFARKLRYESEHCRERHDAAGH